MSDSSNVPSADNTGSGKRHQAGWFDIRNVIGLLLLIYGAVLTFMGLFTTSDEELAKADDLNANLWAGLGILLVGLFFVTWAKLRPIVVDEAEVSRDKEAAEQEPPAH
jgi:hypothetical protein